MSRSGNKKPVGFATHIATGGIAGGCESLACQPLNTIKVRMQLSKSGRAPGVRWTSKTSTGKILLAWLGAGTMEAIVVVTPMEVVKIRLQAQMRSLADPLETPGIGTRDMRSGLEELPSYQHMLIGLISGAIDPFSNAPIDTIKMRTSAKAPATEGASAFERIASIARAMWRRGGPRLMNSTSTLIVRPGNYIHVRVFAAL
ncbi:mitochondrial carrier domain-containing protein [Mycena olivaceomarginata]|nr:mitochondrial carrier domain-containing protein [Mycena olivaceomarginata]